MIEHPLRERHQCGPLLRRVEHVEGPFGEEWHGSRERVGGLLDQQAKA